VDAKRDTSGILPPALRTEADLVAAAGPERVRIWRAQDPDTINRLSLEFARESTAFLGHDSWALLGVATRRGEDSVDLRLLRHDLDRRKIPFAFLRAWAGAEPETAFWCMGIDRHRAFRIAGRFRLEAALYSGPDTRGGVLLFDGAGRTLGFTESFNPGWIAREVSRLRGPDCRFEYVAQGPLEALLGEAIRGSRSRTGQARAGPGRLFPARGVPHRVVPWMVPKGEICREPG